MIKTPEGMDRRAADRLRKIAVNQAKTDVVRMHPEDYKTCYELRLRRLFENVVPSSNRGRVRRVRTKSS